MKISVILAAISAATPVVAAPGYRLIDLGTYAGESHAFAIAPSQGNARVIAGSSTGPDAHFSGFRFAPAAIPIAPPSPLREAAVFDLAADGRAVGVSYNLGSMSWTGFASESGVTTTIGSFVPRSINTAGEMAGTTTVISANFGGLTLPRACRYSQGFVQALPTLGGSTGVGLAIDEAGRVAGSAMNTNNAASKPCLWTGLIASDLGTLGGAGGQVYALRTSAAVGGSQNASGVWHATRWSLSIGGAVVSRDDLGALTPAESSMAHAMNASGDIVGTSAFRAVRWRGGTITDLNTLASAPGWVLENAWDIDDLGRIVGSGSLWGIPRAFLLTVACPADLNSDDAVDDADFALFAAAYDLLICDEPAMPPGCPADLNGDGYVDDADFAAFVPAYNDYLCP